MRDRQAGVQPPAPSTVYCGYAFRTPSDGQWCNPIFSKYWLCFRDWIDFPAFITDEVDDCRAAAQFVYNQHHGENQWRYAFEIVKVRWTQAALDEWYHTGKANYEVLEVVK